MNETMVLTARASRFFGASIVVANVIALYMVAFGVPSTLQIMPEPIRHNRGYAYTVSTPHDWPLLVGSSNADNPQAADTQVFEDGMPLGPAHVKHETIRRKGGGMYSHWDERLFFSTSDNSDPRVNGRTYTARYAVFLAPSALLVVGVADIALVSLWLARSPGARAGLLSSGRDIARAAIAGAIAVAFLVGAYLTKGATFWLALGGALVAVLWCIVSFGPVVARVRSRERRRWRWAGECTVLIVSCAVTLAAAELWLTYQETVVELAVDSKSRLVTSLEAHRIAVPREVLVRAKGRNALLTMPASFDYRRVEDDGPASDYYWHGVLHARDRNGMRRSEPFPARRDGIKRVVVVGDSLTYGVGIPEEATYARALEDLLNKGGDVEVLNLGVNGHQSEDIFEVIRLFVPPLEPDVVIYGVSHNDLLPSGLDQRADKSYAIPVPTVIQRFFNERSRIVRVTNTAYDKTLLALGLRVGFYDQILEKPELYRARFAADTKAMNDFVRKTGLPHVIALVLDQLPRTGSQGHDVTKVLEKHLREAGMDVISTEDYYKAFDGERFRVSKWEGHPNEVANIIWATMFAEHLVDKHGF